MRMRVVILISFLALIARPGIARHDAYEDVADAFGNEAKLNLPNGSQVKCCCNHLHNACVLVEVPTRPAGFAQWALSYVPKHALLVDQESCGYLFRDGWHSYLNSSWLQGSCFVEKRIAKELLEQLGFPRASWLSRALEAVSLGALCGIVLLILAMVCPFIAQGEIALNEATWKEMGEKYCLPWCSEAGQLVHVSGAAKPSVDEILKDPDFPKVFSDLGAIKLCRRVQQFQWVESWSFVRAKTTDGEHMTRKYSYNPRWESTYQDSSIFNQPDGHRNFPFRFNDKTLMCQSPIEVGGYKLSDTLAQKFHKVSIERQLAIDNDAGFEHGEKIEDGWLLIPPHAGKIGEMDTIRICWSTVSAQEVSILAKLSNELEPWIASTGQTVELLQNGSVSAEKMIQGNALGIKSAAVHILLGCFCSCVLFYVGFLLFVKPFAVLFDFDVMIVPLLGIDSGSIISWQPLPADDPWKLEHHLLALQTAFFISVALTTMTAAVASLSPNLFGGNFKEKKVKNSSATFKSANKND